MFLSIVTTLYNSSPHLEEFHARCVRAAEALTVDFELVMVDDGSPDDSLRVARAIQQRDARVRVVELSRNFGHHRAMMTGLEQARGDYVFLIDSDLEEAPELLGDFYERLQSTGADSVYGQQVHRRGKWFERVSGEVFYRTFNALSSEAIPRNLLTVRLMRRDFVRAVTAHREHTIFLAGLMANAGFRQIAMPVTKGFKGRSDYDLVRKVKLAVDGITSFSDRPITILAGLGFAILVLSLLGLTTIVALKLLLKITVPGYASIVLSIWLFGGLTVFSVGVIGLYLGRVFLEVKRRPNAVIRAIHGAPAVPESADAGPREEPLARRESNAATECAV